MPTIQSLGVGSGIDVQGLVDKLVAAEGDPQKERLDRKEADLQNNLTALGVFSGALNNLKESISPLRSAQSFRAMSLRIDNEEVLAASLAENAEPGKYDIDVIQLAEAQRLVSGVFSSELASIGEGVLSFQFGAVNSATKDFEVNPERGVKNLIINEENNNLRGIKDTINKADMGVRASIINDGRGFRLILTSEIPGVNNSLRIKVNDADKTDTDLFGLSTLSYEPTLAKNKGQNIRETSAAKDAIIKIDGIDITSNKNSISNVIRGVTLDIGPQSVGNSTTVEVFKDEAKVSESIQQFITQYNQFVTEINDMTKFDPKTRQAGPLANENAVRNIMTLLRRELGSDFSGVNDNYVTLAALGFDTQREGTVNADSEKLGAAISNDIDEVTQLFAQSGSTTEPLLRYVKGSDDTTAGSYQVIIDQLATQGKYTGSVASPGSFVIDENRDNIKVRIDASTSKEISLNHRSYKSLAAFAAELQSKINGDDVIRDSGAKVSVQVKNNQLVLTSQKYGSNSAVEILEIEGDLARLTGLAPGSGETGQNVAGAIGGVAAVGDGQRLVGQGAAAGLEVDVLGGELGRRGEVKFSRGIAVRLSQLLEKALDTGGLVQQRTQGVSSRLEDIASDRKKLDEKLAKSEEKHIKTFTNLDALVGKMRSTGEYLNRQLANLPGAASTGKNRNK